MKTPEYVRCAACGWVHYAVTRGAAEVAVAEFNRDAEAQRLEQRATLASYYACSRCGADTATFEAYLPEREPGYTMQPVVLER